MSNPAEYQSIDPDLSSMFLADAMRAWFESKHQRSAELSSAHSCEDGGYRGLIVDAFDVLEEAFPYVNLSLVASLAYELEADDRWVSNQSIDDLYFASVGKKVRAVASASK